MAPVVVYLTGFRQHAGKTVTSLGIISQLRKHLDPSEIGYLKPVGQQLVRDAKGIVVDKDVELIGEFAQLPDLPLAKLSPVRFSSNFTRSYLDSRHRTPADARAVAGDHALPGAARGPAHRDRRGLGASRRGQRGGTLQRHRRQAAGSGDHLRLRRRHRPRAGHHRRGPELLPAPRLPGARPAGEQGVSGQDRADPPLPQRGADQRALRGRQRLATAHLRLHARDSRPAAAVDAGDPRRPARRGAAGRSPGDRLAPALRVDQAGVDAGAAPGDPAPSLRGRG